MGTGVAKKAKYTVAVIGATGVVGRESLEILEERRFPLERLRLFASKRSAGESLSCQGREWTIEELTPQGPFQGIDFAFISATDAVSREYGPRLAEAGVVVIDDSAVFRMDVDVPLVVPEVNAHALDSARRRIIAIPNCTTTPLVMVLSAGAEPLVRPYFEAQEQFPGERRVDGILSGLPAAVSYELQNTRPGVALERWNPFGSGMLAAELILLAGAGYGIANWWLGRREQ